MKVKDLEAGAQPVSFLCRATLKRASKRWPLSTAFPRLMSSAAPFWPTSGAGRRRPPMPHHYRASRCRRRLGHGHDRKLLT
jgi:hypothetical protein